MSPEQGAAVATAVTVAEPTSGAPQHATVATPQCANCGAPVTGKYCSRCGQRLEHEMHSVLHFTRDATEDLTHADSRLWSTIIALVLKPGFLTREFLSGRRVRYFVRPAIGIGLTIIVWLYVPYYLFVSMRRVYGPGGWLTFAKLAVLSFTYLICAVVTLAATGAYSMYAA